MTRTLSNYEQETIINFNKAEDVAYIFTYEKTWQRHIEKKLGIKPTETNGFGGKSYEVPKKSIKLPRALRKLSDEAKRKAAETLRRNRVLSAEKQVISKKSATIGRDKGNSISPRKKGQKVAALA